MLARGKGCYLQACPGKPASLCCSQTRMLLGKTCWLMAKAATYKLAQASQHHCAVSHCCSSPTEPHLRTKEIPRDLDV
jgi:hypothetical protein